MKKLRSELALDESLNDPRLNASGTLDAYLKGRNL